MTRLELAASTTPTFASYRTEGIYRRWPSPQAQVLSLLAIRHEEAALLAVRVSAKGDHWYCAHVKDHQRPRADGELSYIEKYDGYYIGSDREDKVIYLTFDAGYENGNVSKVLDILKQKEVPAAFFVLSHLVEANTDLVKRMFDEGHLVCNHTARHKDMSGVTDLAAFEAELKALERVCLEKTGKEMAKYYRPPEGTFSESNLRHAQ